MPSVYTTDAQVGALIGTILKDNLIDLDEDGGDDTAVMTARIADAGAIVDSIVERRYDTPLQNITDNPTTPEIIQLAAKYLVVAEMLSSPRIDAPKLAEKYEKKAYAILNGIAESKRDIPGVEPKPADEQGSVGFAFNDVDGTEPVFASTDDEGDDNMSSW